MRRTTLLNALPIVASVLGRTYGVAVEIGGRDALTNGKKIILPALTADDQKAALLVYGYLDHEAGHVRLTDFTAVRQKLPRPLRWNALCGTSSKISALQKQWDSFIRVAGSIWNA